MPFDNFYEEPDKTVRRWRFALCLAVLLVLGYFAMPFLVSRFHDSSKEPSKESMLVTRRLKSVDEMSKTLPTPEKFYFYRKQVISLEEYSTKVAYLYKSEREFDEIFPQFIVWFDSNGWKTSSQSKLTFIKGNQTITLNRPNGEIYEIICEEFSYEIY